MDQQAQTLIRRLTEARAAITALLPEAEKSMEKEIYPKWTLRHMLAHMTGWDDAIIESLKAHASGKVPATPANRGIDEYNARTVYTRETLDYTHIRKEWEQTRETLLGVLQQMPQEKLIEPLVFPWGRKGKVSHMVDIFIEHEEQHAKEIRLWLNNTSQPLAGSH